MEDFGWAEWTPKLEALKDQLLTVLKKRTSRNRISSEELEQSFDLEYEEIREIHGRLVAEGAPIGTDGENYWRAEYAGDLDGTIEFLRQEARFFAQEANLLKKIDEHLSPPACLN